MANGKMHIMHVHTFIHADAQAIYYEKRPLANVNHLHHFSQLISERFQWFKMKCHVSSCSHFTFLKTTLHSLENIFSCALKIGSTRLFYGWLFYCQSFIWNVINLTKSYECKWRLILPQHFHSIVFPIL